MNFIEYTYLVSYRFSKEGCTGLSAGRHVVTRRARIKNHEDLCDVDRDVAEWVGLDKIMVTSFQLLNWRFVWPFSKEPEPVVEKQPEPRPYHRQVFANGIWQCDLPTDNSEAIVMVLGQFDAHNGFVELERSDTAEDVLLSDGGHNRGYFLQQVSKWLERNPGS